MNDITPKEASEILRHYTDLGYGIIIEGDDISKIVQALSLASKILANGTPYNPTGDLISRSALLNQIDTTDWSDVRLLVEDAPTVELRDNFDLGYAQGLEDARPKGEWIRKDDVIHLLERWSDGYPYIEIPTDNAIKAIKDMGKENKNGIG